ncbi:MarR family transcriptional regulator [Mycolicibacterium sediminis]|uniref:Putative HTH-type transcriptional regulator n=2 Tax=Mycolicibacterium sediminis TaxID=1286180 RepID=A0A7I7QTX1_9MYCO|nr:putative HTH-type transcriptional regulator [Mycolicibacterium sediminis]
MNGSEGQPLGYLLHRVATALRSEVTTTVLDPLELSFPQYICMRMLSHSPGLSNAQLARDVNVSPQAMNMVVRVLQERGLVARPTTVASGRSLPAELTREGTALLEAIDGGVRDAEAKVLAPLDDREQRSLRRLLADLA